MNSAQLISHNRIWAIAGPMILANISTPLLGMVDTAVVGHLSSAIYLGAVAIGTMIFSFLFWGFGFLRMVTTGLTSQAQTQNDANAVFLQSATLAILIATGLILIQAPVSWLAFKLVTTSDAILTEAKLYFDIRIWSAPATLLNYVLMGWLIGKENTRSALFLAITINLSNILLDLLLVNYFDMQTEGVALASVLAEYIGTVIGVLILRGKGLNLKYFNLKHELISLYQNRRSLSLHFNFLLRTISLIFSFAFFTQQGAKFGELILAANMVLLNFITLMAYVLDAFANATEVFAGKAISVKNKVLLKSALTRTGAWSFLMAVIFSIVYLWFGADLIQLLTSLVSVQNVAITYLPWLIAAPVIGVWSYLFDGLFVGATLGKQMRNTMLFSVFICYLPAWFLLKDWGNNGLWAALLFFLAARALTQSIYLPQIMRSCEKG